MFNNFRSEVKSVEVQGGTIQYYEQGSGEPIVFVHGLLVNGHLWRNVVPLLSSQFRCIVPDWPLGSHQLPCEPDAELNPLGLAHMIADFLSALDLNRVTLVGNDTGGALCQVVITTYPDVVILKSPSKRFRFTTFTPIASALTGMSTRLCPGTRLIRFRIVLAPSVQARSSGRWYLFPFTSGLSTSTFTMLPASVTLPFKLG